MAGGKFRFDDGVILATGLTSTFSRGVATIAPTGKGRKATDPRYDFKKLLAGVEPLSVSVVGGHNVLDSGFNNAGTSPVLLTVAVAAGRIRVFSAVAPSGSFSDTTLTTCTIATTSGGG